MKRTVLHLLTPALILFSCRQPQAGKWPDSFGFGKRATPAQIARWDIAIPPDGAGLPLGQGTAAAGKIIYVEKCAACHGTGDDSAGTPTPAPQLISRKGDTKTKTIGNYWPYATTIFDYIRRAMPYNAPGSLTADETYQLTAFLLYANGITPAEKIIDARSLPAVRMPAKELFVPDDRKGGPEIK